MKKFYHEYLSMLKPLPIEGFPDLFIFRPLAFLLVKILYRFPVTPNQVSVSALFTGISSGILFSMGTRESFLWAGILYGVTAVIDCSDGMLARYKKNGVPIGRIIDGTIDYINGMAIFIGLGIGISKMGVQTFLPIWAVILIAAVSMTIHSILVDYHRSQFFTYALNVKHSLNDEIAQFSNELEKLRMRHEKPLSRLLINLYLFYSGIQTKYARREVQYNSQKYYKHNRLTLRFWQVMELSMHIIVLMLSGILYKPELFLYYTIVFANIWMLIAVFAQTIANKKSL